MNCPVCPSQPLAASESRTDPNTHACPTCRGRWLTFNDHLAWLERTSTGPTRPPAIIPALPNAIAPEPAQKARICPVCGRLLTRFRISLDLPFTLDRCGNCAGVWFDDAEWTVVKSAGLLPGLHHLFNDTHQHKLEAEERRRNHEARCRAIVGEEAFERARTFKLWLDNHPHKDALMAFLEDRPEYQPRPAKPFRARTD